MAVTTKSTTKKTNPTSKTTKPVTKTKKDIRKDIEARIEKALGEFKGVISEKKFKSAVEKAGKVIAKHFSSPKPAKTTSAKKKATPAKKAAKKTVEKA